MKALREQSRANQVTKSATLLPAYYYPNKPVALNKTAADSIEMVKNNQLFVENQNKQRNFTENG